MLCGFGIPWHSVRYGFPQLLRNRGNICQTSTRYGIQTTIRGIQQPTGRYDIPWPTTNSKRKQLSLAAIKKTATKAMQKQGNIPTYQHTDTAAVTQHTTAQQPYSHANTAIKSAATKKHSNNKATAHRHSNNRTAAPQRAHAVTWHLLSCTYYSSKNHTATLALSGNKQHSKSTIQANV